MPLTVTSIELGHLQSRMTGPLGSSISVLCVERAPKLTVMVASAGGSRWTFVVTVTDVNWPHGRLGQRLPTDAQQHV